MVEMFNANNNSNGDYTSDGISLPFRPK